MKSMMRAKEPALPKKKTPLGVWIAAAVVVLAAVLLLIPKKTQYAEITIRDYGRIVVVLDAENAPITVKNFVGLVNRRFYDGLTIHRCLDGMILQGGDPMGDGTGGSGTDIKGEFSSNGVNNRHKHTRGTISMARAAYSPDSASSQFFITVADVPSWDGQYAAFGSVVEGMEVVDAVSRLGKQGDENGMLAKELQPVIESVRMIEKP